MPKQVVDPICPTTCPVCGAQNSIKVWVHNQRHLAGLANVLGANGGYYPEGWRATRCDACNHVALFYEPRQ
jgi:hypothetical protein